MRTFLLLLLALVSGCGGCVSVPSFTQLQSTTLVLRFTDGVCSGTAVGQHTILSASHCFKTGQLVSVNGQAAKVEKIVHDGKDHALLRVPVTFKRWAKLSRLPLIPGDRIRYWGTPGGNENVYREGYVARARTDETLMDVNAYKGDSGAGVFNDKGEVAAVVSAIGGVDFFHLMIAFPFAFTPEQYAEMA